VLYDLFRIRDAIHGKRVTAPRLALHDLRQIAAGVLRAVIHWRNARLTRGEHVDWEHLFDEINRAAFQKSDLADVPDLSDLLPSDRRTRQYQ
jgi:hypothetical protein